MKEKRGYLNEEFRIFQLSNSESADIEHHYHEFNKIIFFLSGNVTYNVDSKFYFLQPGDILLIRHHQIHRPAIQSAAAYRRFIVWLPDRFLESNSMTGVDLNTCFKNADLRQNYLLRPSPDMSAQCLELLTKINSASNADDFGSALLTKTLLLQFLVIINRLSVNYDYQEEGIHKDSKIDDIVSYIDEHLTSTITIDLLASKYYISKYYLMRRFKTETGFTLHNYIVQKRLISAASLLRQGESVSTAYLNSGFKDYTTFLRAFKKMYKITPGNYRQTAESPL